MSDIKKFLGVVALTTLTAVPSFAMSPEIVPLRDNERVNSGLITAGIVRRIHKRCPTITYRKFRSFAFLRSVHNRAQAEGYSAEEIEAYVDDPDEEARLYVRVDNWLSSRGAREGDAESYCAVGNAEMTADSQIGNFLRTD
ncbi:DUF5333 domain-containing protein [Halocynthiibacter namhaensis]|uniref:DUF5333 domain-containing protein n=1 Tax=Halocynthiibacter namhaensis TaxID=1290553 RepID=UPI000690CA38|nr:DUF5333 domain-containing protein [Halocynthiibacter namhaensis]